MVLDPFSALGLASNIVQFVDFSSILISDSRELYRSVSGITIENGEVKEATEELQRLCDRLAGLRMTSSTTNALSKEEECLRKLAISCRETSHALLSVLRDITAQEPRKKWQTFRVALKSVLKKDQIQELEKKLDSHRSQLALQLMAMSR